MNIAFLVNPTSARGRGASAAGVAQQRFVDAGLSVERLVGRDAAEASELGRGAVDRGVDALVVCGGDGMAHLGTQLVAGTETPIGIIPAGTGNDVARYLDLDLADPGRAADTVIAGRVRSIDLGRATRETPQGTPAADPVWFVTVAAAGFDSKVTDRANRMTRPAGRLRYDLAMLIELGVFKPIPYRIQYDDVTVETSAMLVAVGNGPSYGGGMKVTAQASLTDGLFDVLYLEPLSKPRFVAIFPHVYAGTHLRRDEVHVRRSRRVRLSAPDVTAWADGEILGPLPMSFETVPRALRVLAGPPSGPSAR